MTGGAPPTRKRSLAVRCTNIVEESLERIPIRNEPHRHRLGVARALAFARALVFIELANELIQVWIRGQARHESVELCDETMTNKVLIDIVTVKDTISEPNPENR